MLMGNHMSFNQSANAHGGMLVETAEGGDTAWSTVDQNGNPINQDPVTGVWESRTVDLSSLVNQHINLMAVGLDQATTVTACDSPTRNSVLLQPTSRFGGSPVWAGSAT